MKKNLLLLSAILLVITATAQTNVSGGIYANTTWTLANSPYIVTDTIAVFPDVVLTIEPGVTVKFADNKRLEIRYARLIAEGTSVDPITFTSNSGSPQPGSWSYIWLNHDTSSRFNYCNFSYADTAICMTLASGLQFRNSNFSYNKCGIVGLGNGTGFPVVDSCNFTSNTKYGIYYMGNTTVSNCTFSNDSIAIHGSSQYYNKVVNCIITGCKFGIVLAVSEVINCTVKNCSTGIKSAINLTIRNCTIDSNTTMGIYARNNDTIQNCTITNNGIGISLYKNDVVHHNVIEDNTTGIEVPNAINSVYCNRICNNSTYNLSYGVAFGNNGAFASNYWCTNDSATIAAGIFDGYDNINYSLAQFTPFDTTQCYQHTCSAYFIVYPDNVIQHIYTVVNMANGSGTLSYVWNWGDGNTDTIAYPSHTYASAGIYPICLTITDAAGCSSYYCNNFSLQHTTNTMIYVNVVANTNTGITPISNQQSTFSIFPNPATNTVTITIDESMIGSTATVTDVTGRGIVNYKLEMINTPLQTGNLANGVYLVTITGTGGGSATKKLIVQH